MNKEEIIQKLKMHLAVSGIDHIANVLAAEIVNNGLDTYAEQESREKGIAFAEWTQRNNWVLLSGMDKWVNDKETEYTTSELYTIFLTETKKG